MTTTLSKKKKVNEEQTSNGAESFIVATEPYMASVTIEGKAPLLFHAWNTEAVAEKAAAAKNSKTKKTDDLESYLYRTSEGYVGIAGKCLHGALVEAGRYFQDPRSPRKSARDLMKAALIVLTPVAPFQPKTQKWDYEDRQRVVIQRSAVTRTRPAMKEGWKVTFDILVNAPEYISPQFLQELLAKAGSFQGLCDYRPTYGRFNVVKFEV